MSEKQFEIGEEVLVELPFGKPHPYTAIVTSPAYNNGDGEEAEDDMEFIDIESAKYGRQTVYIGDVSGIEGQ